MFRGLDRRYVSHSLDDIDFRSLRGKRVGVIGAGASAIDSAAEALEHGAARAAMLVRRPTCRASTRAWASAARASGTASTPHRRAEVEIVNYIDEQAVPPPRNSMLRVSRHGNFSILARCAPRAVRDQGRPRAARHHARAARIRPPDPRDRPRGRLAPAAGVCRAEAARPALGRSISRRTATPTTRRPTTPISGPHSNSSSATPARALGQPHPLLQLSRPI